jgi:hypothetical protein
MNGFRPVTVAILASVAVAACDSLATNPSLYGTVDVSVTRRNGDGIPGVNLVLYTFQRPMAYAVSGVAGAHRFESVPEGRYGVGAAPPTGYVGVPDANWDYVDQLTLQRGGSVSAHLHFLKQGYATIVAEVREFGGPAIGQVAVTLRGAAGSQRAGSTDATGRFSFDSLPAGSYAVTALRTAPWLDGSASPLLVRDSIVVEDGSRETASFAFVRSSAPASLRAGTTARARPTR